MKLIELELADVEADDLRRFLDLRIDKNGRPNDMIRANMLRKLRKAVLEASTMMVMVKREQQE